MTVFLILVAAVALVALIVYVSNSKSKEEANRYKEKQSNDSNKNNQEWVDLGLPSGTKWATCNIGAKKPEDLGTNCIWLTTTLRGKGWRTPTADEFYELKQVCLWKRWRQNGVNGYKVTGPSAKSIFLPCTCLMIGEYWTSTPNYKGYSEAWFFYFALGSDDYKLEVGNWDTEMAIRLVKR